MRSYVRSLRYKRRSNFSRKRSAFPRKIKSYQRKYGQAPPANVIVSQDAMPSILQTRFPYCANHNITTTLGTAYTYYYRGNSGFDPDATGTGNQPNGWDQMSVFYNKVTILGSRIRVTFINLGEIALQACVAPVYTNSAVAYDVVSTLPHSKEIFIGPYRSGQDIKTVSCYMSTRKIMGKDPLPNPDLSQSFTANPVSQWYWAIFGQPTDQTTNASFTISVSITYYVQLSERRTVVQS